MRDIIISVATAAILGISGFLFNFFSGYISRKKRLVYGLYTELLANHELLDGCINYDEDIKGENIPRLSTEFYNGNFARSGWTKFFNRVKPLRIPENIKKKELLKRFERLNGRPFVSSIHLLYARISLLNYVCIDSHQEGRSFNKSFIYKTRAINIRYDLFVLIHNLELKFNYLGKRTV